MHSNLYFSVEKEGGVFDYLAFQYKNFETFDAQYSSPKVRFKKYIDTNNKIIKKYADKNKTFCRIDNDQFHYFYNSSVLALDGNRSLINQKDVLLGKDFNKQEASMVCDLLFRLHLIKDQKVLVHCAAVSKAGEVTLFSASKGMGKTTVALKMVQSGYQFMSDDRIWVDADSIVYSYPRYVVLKYNNIEYFDFLVNPKKLALNNLYIRCSGLFEGAIGRFLLRVMSRFFKYPSSHFYIDEVCPDAIICEKSRISRVVALSKSPVAVDNFVSNLTDKELSCSAAATCNIEWNIALMELASAHDFLFPEGPSWIDELQFLIDSERKVISDAFKSLACFSVSTPEKNINYPDLITQIDDL